MCIRYPLMYLSFFPCACVETCARVFSCIDIKQICAELNLNGLTCILEMMWTHHITSSFSAWLSSLIFIAAASHLLGEALEVWRGASDSKWPRVGWRTRITGVRLPAFWSLATGVAKLRLARLQQTTLWRRLCRSQKTLGVEAQRSLSLVLSSGSFMTKAAVNHVYTTAKEDAGMGMDVDFVIFAQQNRSERGRVDNIICSEHSKENVPKHKYKDCLWYWKWGRK